MTSPLFRDKRILVTGGAHFICPNLFDNKMFEFLRYDITWPLCVEVNDVSSLACPAGSLDHGVDA